MYDLKELEEFFSPFAEVLDEFVKAKRLECEKWRWDSPSILFGRDMTTPHFMGMRRSVEIHLHPGEGKIYILASAFSDETGRRLKSIYLFGENLKVMCLDKFKHYLDTSWRIALSIKRSELLDVETWQNDGRQQRVALDISCSCCLDHE